MKEYEESLVQLIPFKVTTLPIPGIIQDEYFSKSIRDNFYNGIKGESKNNLKLESMDWYKIQEITKGKVWTVAGIKNDMLLLVRTGELSQWYPKSGCVVQNEEGKGD
jgi:hypothetical protein